MAHINTLFFESDSIVYNVHMTYAIENKEAIKKEYLYLSI